MKRIVPRKSTHPFYTTVMAGAVVTVVSASYHIQLGTRLIVLSWLDPYSILDPTWLLWATA